MPDLILTGREFLSRAKGCRCGVKGYRCRWRGRRSIGRECLCSGRGCLNKERVYFWNGHLDQMNQDRYWNGFFHFFKVAICVSQVCVFLHVGVDSLSIMPGGALAPCKLIYVDQKENLHHRLQGKNNPLRKIRIFVLSGRKESLARPLSHVFYYKVHTLAHVLLQSPHLHPIDRLPPFVFSHALNHHLS